MADIVVRPPQAIVVNVAALTPPRVNVSTPVKGPKGDAGPRGADAQVATATPQLTVEGWADNAQTVAASGVTASNFVMVAPAPASHGAYVAAGIRCTAQGVDSLTFTCEAVPEVAIDVNVGVIG